MRYVGVSGINAAQQVDVEATFSNAFRAHQDIDLLLGIKATEKTQWLDTENKYGTLWYPVGEDIARAYTQEFYRSIPALQIHLGELGEEESKQFLSRLHERTRDYRHLWYQFDKLDWMNGGEGILQQVRSLRRNGSVILQCYGEMMAEYHPYQLVRRLKRLHDYGLVDLVLFDASHGTGKALDPEALRPFVGTAYEALDIDEIGIGIAGGLDGLTVRRHMPELLDEFPEISWDAEGKLHSKNKENDGALILSVVEDYLRASAEVINANRAE